MKKWNKYDTNFIVKSIAASILAIILWLSFDSYIINENYYDISLNEEGAKHRALNYIASRGWDITDYTYASSFYRGSEEYLIGNTANNDKDIIKQIDKLAGHHRWRMRWFNPPNEHEINIAYTKDGDLAYFERILPDTLAGDSLPEYIAYNIAKMFMKNMIDSKWDESDWDLKEKSHDKKKNRLDYYFEWENNKYKFDETTIRMSLQVSGNEVVRYNRYIHTSENLAKQKENWDSISSFYWDINAFLQQILIIVSILISLFYFKIQTKWNVASKYMLFLVIVILIHNIAKLPINMYWMSSEDTIISSMIFLIFNYIVNALFQGFIFIISLAACEKLYRKIFPNFLSFSSLLSSKSYNSKLFFNNYIIGIVFGLYALTLSAVFYYGVTLTGHYIEFNSLDNDIVHSYDLLNQLTWGISTAFDILLPFCTFILLIYLITKSKWISVISASLIFGLTSITGLGYEGLGTDPIFIFGIYYTIVFLMGGYLLFEYGILSVISYFFSATLFKGTISYFYMGEADFITTAIIAIIILLIPPIYCLLHYIKYRWTTNSDLLLNSAEDISGVKTLVPTTPKLEILPSTYSKWAVVLCIIGISCLFINSNDELKDFWSFQISESAAIDEARDNIENNYNIDLSKYRVATNHHSRFRYWNSMDLELGPLSIIKISSSFDLAYLMEKIGRPGILDLFQQNNLSPNAWNVKFFKPDYPEYYYASIDSRDKNLIYYYHHLSDTISKPSVDRDEAEEIIINTLKSQNIDVSNLPIHKTNFEDLDVRSDHQIEYEKDLIANNQFKIKDIIKTKISGNLFTEYERYFKVPEEWIRNYQAFSPLSILMLWGSLITWILSWVICSYYLIRNSYIGKYELSWKLLIGTMVFNFSIIIIDFINKIPIFNAWNYGNRSWLTYWLDDRIGELFQETAILNIFILLPIYCMYLIYPNINKLFTKTTLKTYGKDAFISSIATLGAMLLYYPIKYLLYANFPNYIEHSISAINIEIFSTYLPGLALLLNILITSLWILAITLVFYNKYIEYALNGKNITKYLILIAASIFYMFSFSFWSTDMLPHFIAKFSGLVLFFILIKYYWKNNPLSHLFGILIYFHLDRILNFIHLADPSIKPQGYFLLIMIGVLFIYSVGLDAFKDRFLSKSS